MPIRNIVFDVGNVLVPWDPAGIEAEAFGHDQLAAEGFVPPLRGNPVWLAVNKGELSLEDAKAVYVDEQGFEAAEIDALWAAMFASFTLMRDTRLLMDQLKVAGYRLFAITDNVQEVVAHLKITHDFWPLFEVAAVSADLGFLKPDPRIYQWLLDTAQIPAHECVFLDDVQHNVDGAKAVGMSALVFTDAGQARRDLHALGIDIEPNS